MPLEDVGIHSLTKTYSLLDDSPLEGPDSITSTSSGCSNISSGYSSGKFRPRTYQEEMGTTKYELEDYIYEMECRQTEAAQRQNELDEETQDIYTRLAQKEQDLILAAELGKALLERNEVLVQQNEKLAEDYSHKLEVSRVVVEIIFGETGSVLRGKTPHFRTVYALSSAET